MRNNDFYRGMIEDFLNHQHFYFSYTYDLTHCFQNLQETSPEFHNQPLYERVRIIRKKNVTYCSFNSLVQYLGFYYNQLLTKREG